MPIAKALSYSRVLGPADPLYPCLYSVRMEPTLNDITAIRNINVGEAVYMIKEWLLGAQALSLKFKESLQAGKGFYSVNRKGQVKVWPTDDLMAFRQESSK